MACLQYLLFFINFLLLLTNTILFSISPIKKCSMIIAGIYNCIHLIQTDKDPNMTYQEETDRTMSRFGS